MDKKKVYQQINQFKLQMAKDYDKKDIKDVDRFYWYVSDEEAKDKAYFIKYLIENDFLDIQYKDILDLTFGSGNLTSHIVLDSSIQYNNIIFNDLNTIKTNQDIVNVIDNSSVKNLNILDIDSFKDYESDLIIFNPQIGGGTYPEGDISSGKTEKETFEQLVSLVDIFLSKNKTLIFYGRTQHFEKIFKDYNFINYQNGINQLYIISKTFEKRKCFQKIEDSYQEIDCNNQILNDNDEIEDFDNLDLILNSCSDSKEDNKENQKVKKIKFSDEAKGNLEFPYKNILFKGVPGTGKSRAINEIIKNKLELVKNDKNILRINIHSASSNSDLMQGIGISTTINGNIKYSEKQGLILDIIKRATFNPNQPFVLILEEIQENSLNELIGDLIYLIEDDKRAILKADNLEYETYEELVDKLVNENDTLDYVEIPYLVNDSTDYKKMIMPNNLYIFCTSNYRDDKKVIEDNLLRRFEVIEIYPKNQAQMGKDKKTDEYYFKNEDISNFLESLNTSILRVMNENHEIHPDRFMIGHAIWQNVNDEKSFYKSFLKLIVEFKDIREIEFEIFNAILKDLTMPHKLETYNNYYEMIKDIQSKINYEFID